LKPLLKEIFLKTVYKTKGVQQVAKKINGKFKPRPDPAIPLSSGRPQTNPKQSHEIVWPAVGQLKKAQGGTHPKGVRAPGPNPKQLKFVCQKYLKLNCQGRAIF